uniref:Uncharacterized protein n=1 Tax=Scleropages formosus TaxID=113540 RepID=A0A8C9V184_SCLFO
VVRLRLPVQALLHHQLRYLGAVASRLDLQAEQVVRGDLVGLHAEGARIRVAGRLQGEARARGRVLRDLHVDVVGGEAGRVVVQVLDLDLDHADLHGVGHHLQRYDALGGLPARGVPVDLLLGDEQPRRADVHPVRLRVGDDPQGRLSGVHHEASVLGVLGHVRDDRARSLLLVHGVLEVDHGVDPTPAQQSHQHDLREIHLCRAHYTC